MAKPMLIDLSMFLDVLASVMGKSERGVWRTLRIVLHREVELCLGDASVGLGLHRHKVHRALGFNTGYGVK